MSHIAELNLEELHRELQSYGINESEYHLHGLFGSKSDNDKLSLNMKKGKYGIEYEVYYRERGEKHSARMFYNESEACQYIFDQLRESKLIERIRQVVGIEGMTVNERLWETNLMDEFDKAKKREPKHAKRILRLLKVDKPSIEKIVK